MAIPREAQTPQGIASPIAGIHGKEQPPEVPKQRVTDHVRYPRALRHLRHVSRFFGVRSGAPAARQDHQQKQQQKPAVPVPTHFTQAPSAARGAVRVPTPFHQASQQTFQKHLFPPHRLLRTSVISPMN